MKVRTTFPQIWFGSANRVELGTGWRSGSYRMANKNQEVLDFSNFYSIKIVFLSYFVFLFILHEIRLE